MKKKVYIILLLFVLIAFTSFSIYAAFNYTNLFKTTMTTYEITNASLSESELNVDYVFEAPGDSQSYEYHLTNSDTLSYCYNFSIESVSVSATMLNMIYVYFNDEFVGVLSDLITSSTFVDDTLFIFPFEQVTNVFKFELHNSSFDYDSQEISFKIKCNLKTYDNSNYIFIKDEEQLIKAVDDVNQSLGNRTIVMYSDIVLNKTLQINNNVIIDLAGNTLTLNADININGDATYLVDVKDSRGGGIVLGTSKIILNSPTALLIPQLDLTSNLQINQYNEALLLQHCQTYLWSLGIISAEINLLGFFNVYIGKGLSIAIDGITSNDAIYTPSSSITNVITVTLRNQNSEVNVDLKVIGVDDVIGDILTSELVHLYPYIDANNTIQISHNIYLPTNLRNYNATVSYFSHNLEIISNDGILQPDSNGLVQLTATIKVNDKIYIQDYYLHILQQDNQSKLQYLATKIELDMPIFRLIYNQSPDTYYTLPILDNYKNLVENKDLGIVELAYDIESTYYYMGLEMTTEDLQGQELITDKKMTNAIFYLKEVTYQKAARLIIRAKFENGETAYAYINASIALDQSALSKQIFSDIQDYLDNIDVLQLILDTRSANGVLNESGDFTLPNEIGTVKITYEVPQGDVQYFTISPDNPYIVDFDGYYENFEITDMRIPIKVNIMNENVIAESKILYFTIPGAITPNSFAPFSQTINDEIFYTIKQQTLQQSTSQVKYDNNKLLVDANKSEIFNLTKCIFIHDVLLTNELYFEYGNSDLVLDKYDLTALVNVFQWATSSSTDTFLQWAQDNNKFSGSFDIEISWIKADGKPTLSDGEIEFIVHFAQKYASFSVLFYNYINTLDNTLSEDDIADLKAILTSDQTFVKILEWVMFNEEISLSAYLKDLYLNDLQDLNNDGLVTVSNDEEHILLQYVMIKYVISNDSQDIDKYKNFISVWTKAVIRDNDISDGSIRKIETQENSYNTPCYDPLFISLLDWVLYYGTGDPNTSASTLGDYLQNYDSNMIKEIFTEEQLGYTNNWLYYSPLLGSTTYECFVSLNEWKVIEYYLKFYDLDYSIESTNFNNSQSTSEPQITNPEYLEVNRISGLFYAYYGTNFKDSFILTMITDINNKYINSTTSNFNYYFDFATAIDFSDYNVIVDNMTDNVHYDKLIINDGLPTISYDEYLVLDFYFKQFEQITMNFNQEVSVDSINVLKSLSKFINNYYWSKNDSLLIDISSQNLSSYRNQILNAIDPDLSNFEIFINNIIKLGYEAPNDGDYFDNLSTVSKSELEYLANFFKDDVNFINKLNEVITAYRVNIIDGDVVVEEVIDNVDRELSDEDQNGIINAINSLYGNEGQNKEYSYIQIDQINEENEEAFEVLRYYTSLESIYFIGSQFHNLFANSSVSNNIFQTLCNSVNNIKSITYTYCALSSIKGIEVLNSLEYLDIKGNSSTYNGDGLSDVSSLLLLALNEGVTIKYLNIYDTDVNKEFVILYLLKLYQKYEANNPTYYYDLDGIETLFVPDGSNLIAMELATLLKEINSVSNQYLYLTSSVKNTNYVGNVTYRIVEGSGYASINGYVLQNLNNGGVVIISATIEVEELGESYTRYFIVEMIKY